MESSKNMMSTVGGLKKKINRISESVARSFTKLIGTTSLTR